MESIREQGCVIELGNCHQIAATAEISRGSAISNAGKHVAAARFSWRISLTFDRSASCDVSFFQSLPRLRLAQRRQP
jgi:hypothetical protein